MSGNVTRSASTKISCLLVVEVGEDTDHGEVSVVCEGGKVCEDTDQGKDHGEVSVVCEDGEVCEDTDHGKDGKVCEDTDHGKT